MKRKNYISWDQYFMGVAILSGNRSKDPSRQVGCCIVDDKNRILTVGYNGLPNGCSDDEYSWDKEDENDNKYMYVVHSELNAIINYRGRIPDNSRMYVTTFPCNECAKAIIQAGISEVIYYDDYSKMEISMRMFNSAGVKVRKYTPTSRNIMLSL